MKTRLCAGFALLAVLAGCGESRDERAAHDAVMRFYEGLKRHDPETVCALLSPAVAKQVARDGTCVGSMRQFFERVARSADPGYFDKLPDVRAAIVKDGTATVVVRRGPQRRRVSLKRVGDSWRISGSPDFQ
ncbi:MAG TPA: hypothetical protein VFN64_03680 [Burkholderiaceae bacterium]|nr:hypothetical protein [Burkholderiaceae bacterium]